MYKQEIEQLMRKWIRRIGWIVAIPVVLLLLVSLALYIPPVQHWVVQQAVTMAEQQTGMQIRIGQIRLSFPLDLSVRQVEVVDVPEADSLAQASDTLLRWDDLRIRIQALPLFRKQLLVEAIELKGLRADTGDWLESGWLQGEVGRLYARIDRVDLSAEHATLNRVELADASLRYVSTAPDLEEDTTTTDVPWVIDLEQLALDRVSVELLMPADSLRLQTEVGKARLQDGYIDLGQAAYGIGRLELSQSAFAYDLDNQDRAAGLDVMHVRLSQLETRLSDLYYSEERLAGSVEQLSLAEASGLQIESLTGSVRGDSLLLELPDWHLRMPHSEARWRAHIPWQLVEIGSKTPLQVQMEASFGKEDLWIASGLTSEEFRKAYPEQPLTMRLALNGNAARLALDTMRMHWPGVLDLQATGTARMITDSLQRGGTLTGGLRTDRIQFFLALLPATLRERYALPDHMQVEAQAHLQGDSCRAALQLQEQAGRVQLEGGYRFSTDAYQLALAIDSLQLDHFMPHDSLRLLSATLHAHGKGFDPMAPATEAVGQLAIPILQYGDNQLSALSMELYLQQQVLQASLRALDPLIRMDLSLEAQLQEKDLKAQLKADVQQVDLYALHALDHPFATAFQLVADAASDGDEQYQANLSLSDWNIRTDRGSFRPKDLMLKAHSNADTTLCSFQAGDLLLSFAGDACIHELTDQLTKVSDELLTQFQRDTTLNFEQLRPFWPRMSLNLQAGQDNPIYNYLANYYMDFESFVLQASTSPEAGLRMESLLLDLATDTFVVDTIRASLLQDSLGLAYRLQTVKNRYRKQEPFRATVEGQIRPTSSDACFHYQDGAGKTGLLLGVRVDRLRPGFRFSLFPEQPIIAFRPFSLNPNNYLDVYDWKSIAADMRLTGERYASLWIHSDPEEEAAYDPVHVELSQIDLSMLSKGFAYLPDMQGVLNATLQYAPADSGFMVVADTHIDNLLYEQKRVGELFLNAIYLPLEAGNHQVDAHLFRDQQEISTLTALYQAGETNDSISGAISFLHLPLEMADPFIPDDMARMQGDLDGELTIQGPATAPEANGYLRMDSAAVYIGAVGSSYRFDSQPVTVRNNRLHFHQYKLYAYGKEPLVMEGTVDFSDPARLLADLQLDANNLQLFQVKRNSESLVYGKMFVNLRSTLKGPVDALTMRGDLQVLGNTDVTYVMQDSPLTVQDRLSELVTFTSFADSVRRKMPRKPPLPLGGLDMLMTIRVDPAVRANVDLTPDQSSHVNLEGGGDLSFQYTPQGDMLLNGRYTLTGGTFKYAMPVIPLKAFTIQSGSYVQWNGPVLNPAISLTATERMRATVSGDGQSPRSVNFDVGVQVKDHLETPALQFILEAPEDQSMSDELSAKGAEERGKLAVSMLVTGMYLGSSSNGKMNVNMGSALNSFLQSEINNIAGSALKSVDLSIGMDSYDENGAEGGGSRTDYSFRFAKRFYNDRIQVVLGGRISTGDHINNGQAQPFIDNVSVEYRLDNSGSRYVKLFHNKNYESLLEGEIIETGAGIVLRRKMRYLRELFKFKSSHEKAK